VNNSLTPAGHTMAAHRVCARKRGRVVRWMDAHLEKSKPACSDCCLGAQVRWVRTPLRRASIRSAPTAPSSFRRVSYMGTSMRSQTFGMAVATGPRRRRRAR